MSPPSPPPPESLIEQYLLLITMNDFLERQIPWLLFGASVAAFVKLLGVYHAETDRLNGRVNQLSVEIDQLKRDHETQRLEASPRSHWQVWTEQETATWIGLWRQVGMRGAVKMFQRVP